MKKIVAFKKDIIFKTQLAEITSISLEHTLHKSEDNLITGDFIVSGEYRMTDSSTTTDAFSFNLPFDIDVDDRYNIDSVVVDIDDFYYEIVDENILSINIEVSLDRIYEKPLLEDFNVNLVEDTLEDEIMDFSDKIPNEKMIDVREEEPMERENISSEEVISLFDNLDDSNETYSTYHVHIVRDGDSLEAILQKYNVTKEDIEPYNDLKELSIGVKLIIPSLNRAKN